MEKYRILIVDDEKEICDACASILKSCDYIIETALNGAEAFRKIGEKVPDIVIADVNMPGMNGMELLRRTKKAYPEISILLITGYSTVGDAVEAMKLGASDYIPKPFMPEELRVKVSKMLESKGMIKENKRLKKELGDRYAFGKAMGKCQAMQKIYDLLEKVSCTDSTILITGESGTGKELVAHAIHHNSPRKGRPFVSVDCSSLSENLMESELFGHMKGSFTGAAADRPGLFETAEGGTLFMDEIGNITLGVQAKLLRVLQEKEFKRVGDVVNKKADVRIIAATNKNLKKMVKDSSFREDLFYRLNVVPVHIPPLRERKEDIPLFIENFLSIRGKGSKVRSFSPEAMNLMMEYNWPGNVRELENLVERLAVTVADESVLPNHLPNEFRKDEVRLSAEVPRSSDKLKEAKRDLRAKAVEELEKLFVSSALERNNGNVSRTALEVKMKRQNFHSLMRKHGIRRREEYN